MLTLEIGIFLVVVAIGVVAYLFGRRVGYDDGYNYGYVAGHTAGVSKSHPGSVRVISPRSSTPDTRDSRP